MFLPVDTSSQEQELVFGSAGLLSSSLDNAVLPGSTFPSVLEDLKVYQDLLHSIAAFLGIQAEFLQENTCKLMDVLQPAVPGRVAA